MTCIFILIIYIFQCINLQLLNYIYIILLILIVFQEMITGLTEDIAKKREEIKHQQAQITQLAKERDGAVTKITSLQEEFKRKNFQIREENQKKIKEYIDDANHWRLQVNKYMCIVCI